MFCEGCGKEINADAMFCSGCGITTQAGTESPERSYAGVRPPSSGALSVAEHAKVASKDTMQALKVFVKDPTGSVLPVYESLEPGRAIGVGIALAVLFDLCFLFAGNRLVNGAYNSIPFLGIFASYGGVQVPWLKLFILGLVPFACIVVALITAHKLFRGTGAIPGDVLVAGLALLPLAIAVAVSSIIGVGNIEIISILFLFVLTYTILILFVGCARIAQISEPAAALAVPLILLFSAWLLKVVYVAIFSSRVLF
ncbi:MAG: heat shock protein DnaJ-like protein [Chthonomonadales bacterium]|nr:heat shock protein DnaJ-like protein [Chthonomonadales bacterium]